MKFPQDLKYTKDHEWIREKDDVLVIGITDYAQDQLGDVTFVDVQMDEGDEVEAGAVFATIESVKAVSDCFAPLDGEIVAINPALADTPELVNEDVYGEGWLVEVRAKDPQACEGMLDAAAYAALIEEE